MSVTVRTHVGKGNTWNEYQLHSKDPGIQPGNMDPIAIAGICCVGALNMKTDTIGKKILCVGICTGAGAALGGIIGGPPGAAKGAVVGVIVGVTKVIIDEIRDACRDK